MKRLLMLFVGLVSLLSFAQPSDAACKWVTKEIRWLRTYTSGVSVFPHDTAYASVGGGGGTAADTTGWFTLDGLCATNLTGRQVGGVANDSALVAVVTFVSDTTVAFAPNTTALTCVVDMGGVGSPGDQLNNLKLHQAVIQASTSFTIASGDDNAAIPIFVKTQVDNKNLQYGVLAGMPIRVRVASSTGTNALAMCRAFVTYPMETNN